MDDLVRPSSTPYPPLKRSRNNSPATRAAVAILLVVVFFSKVTPCYGLESTVPCTCGNQNATMPSFPAPETAVPPSTGSQTQEQSEIFSLAIHMYFIGVAHLFAALAMLWSSCLAEKHSGTRTCCCCDMPCMAFVLELCACVSVAYLLTRVGELNQPQYHVVNVAFILFLLVITCWKQLAAACDGENEKQGKKDDEDDQSCGC